MLITSAPYRTLILIAFPLFSNKSSPIYTSILLGHGFNPSYLKAYIEAYLWGSATVLFVNIFVFPLSSERELRQLLVMSLEHVATYSHLLSKTYTLTITDEERDARARLAQTIRADFGLLTMKMAETSAEINWSRWSMGDYLVFVGKTRAVQLALITAHTSISNIHSRNTTLFKEYFLPSTLKPFQRLRRDIDITIQEISQALGGPPPDLLRPTEHDVEQGVDNPGNALDTKAEGGETSTSQSTESGVDTPARVQDPDEQDEIRERLKRVAAKLAQEVEHEGMSPAPQSTSLVTSPTSTTAVPVSPDHEQPSSSLPCPPMTGKCTCGSSALMDDFESFRSVQQDLLGRALLCGKLHGGNNGLRLYEDRKSMAQEEGRDWVRGDEIRQRRTKSRAESTKTGTGTATPKSPVTPRPESIVGREIEEGRLEPVDDAKKAGEDEVMVETRQCLVRVYSLLYALNQFTYELSTFHDAVMSRQKQSKRIHVHLFETLAGKVRKAEKKRRERADRARASTKEGEQTGDMEIDDASQVEDRELNVREALAILEQKEYIPKKMNIWQKLERAERLLESPTSIYAAKTAAATLIFAVLIWAPATRQWFISYGLTGGLITVVVALTPTLGQTLFTFVMQIVGSALGYIWAIVVLEAFKDVGGYRFNPYGIICLIAIYALPFQYLIYEKPMFFTLALLALNATGVVVVTEWVYQQYQGRHAFDSPPYRAGKALSALAVALAIVGTFQLIVLRNPARRQLRESTARIVYGLLGYNTILQAYVRATMPADPAFRAPQAALERVEHDLRHREMKLQTALIEVMPLLMYANSEPQLAKPFRGDIVNKILKSCRIILDRYREARAAIGTEPFDEFIIEEFISVLSPYRRRFTRTIKTSFYLVASSLANKFPLPHDIQGTVDMLPDFVHDALVLSTRMARTEMGAGSVRGGEFSRYWYYLLSVSTIGEQLKEMEMACKELFGELEDHPKVMY
ncbi:fusaric acid resistance-like protein [Ceratobasidium sp. AG-Ba]|nr:fusaric acid resistance-like protein [Ceratobasidium sp. AG-Ba]